METNLDFDYTFQLEMDDGSVLEGGSAIELEVETAEEEEELDTFDAYMIALETIIEQLYMNADDDFDLDMLPNLTVRIENLKMS